MSASVESANLARATQPKAPATPAVAPSRASAPTPWRRYLLRALSLLAALVLWQLASATKLTLIINFKNIPTPQVVGHRFVELLSTSAFYVHIAVSMKRILISFALATVAGVTGGVLMGRSRLATDLIMPHIETLRPIPAVAWIPLSIVLFPTEEASIIYITLLGAFFPILLNTIHGVQQTPETLVRAAQSLGADNRAILRHVVLPGALPSIVTGLSIGMGVAWFSLLAGEIISGQYGIGYFTWSSYTLVQYPEIIVGMLTIGWLGTATTWLVRRAAQRALRWQEERE
jgi:NitT/TauT family transport system permease protein